MAKKSTLAPDVELAREVVVELVRTGWAIADALESLLEALPGDAFPGEDNGEVLLEMVADLRTAADRASTS
jgi:hypothetical protein